ncbi:MAG: dipeptidase [Flavobacteriaceae bacterium]|nr:dipeptidase [Flavobacteriaceae bacterium]
MKIKFLVLVLIIFSSSCKNDNKTTEPNKMEKDSLALKEEARRIHEKVITLDTHVDIDVDNFTDSINYTSELDTQVNLPKMEEGGLDVAWFIVYTGQDTLTEEGFKKAYENAISKFDAIHRLTKEIGPDRIELATSSEDVRRIVGYGKLAAMIGIENGYPIGKDISRVEEFYNKGARYMSLAHNGHSQLSDSNTGEKDDVWLHNGLSDLGKEVIKEMNRVGMMIDISHPSKEAIRQMIELSKAPVIASHSSARALSEHSRNLDDEQLMWVKDNGGVVQTVALDAYVNADKNDAYSEFEKDVTKQLMEERNMAYLEREDVAKLDNEAREAYYEAVMAIRPKVKERLAEMENLPPRVDVADFVDHIDYMVEKIGIDHVGISSDFDGGGGIEGWDDASETFNVTLELVKRGYSEEEIEKLWSGNLLRVLDEVTAISQKIQKGEI